MTSTTTLPASAALLRNYYLTTYGRVSGRPHEIEIWIAADPDDAGTLYLLSGGRDRSDWVKNIRRNPSVIVRAGDGRYRGAATILATGDARDLRAREVVAAKYQGWRPGQPFSQWARESLAVIIYLEGAIA